MRDVAIHANVKILQRKPELVFMCSLFTLRCPEDATLRVEVLRKASAITYAYMEYVFMYEMQMFV